MKIAILTSGIIPVPAVQGGAVETLVDHYMEYNDKHQLHNITVYSVYHPAVWQQQALQSAVNHYVYIDTNSWWAKLRKFLHGKLHKHTYYHYSMDFFFQQALSMLKKSHYDCIVLENRPGYALQLHDAIDAKLVYHLHNDFLNNNTPQAQTIYQAATKILTVSDYIKGRVLTCNANDQKTITVHNGIDLAAFDAQPTITRQQMGYSDEDVVLAFSGRLVKEKGIMELIEAMNLLKDEPHLKLMVMGSSFFENAATDDPFITNLKARAKDIGDRIRFTGYVKHEMMPDYLRLTDIAVIPSTWDDPFPTTVLEGMAAALPLITTNRGGIPEMVTNENAIVVSYPGDFTQQLAQAILTLAHNKEQRLTMGQASKRLSQQYTKEQYAQNFFEAIGSL